MTKIVDWIKKKLEDGSSQYEAETNDGNKCSMKIKKVDDKTKEIFDKVGSSECLDKLKERIVKAEG